MKLSYKEEFGGIAHNNQIIIMSDAEGYTDQDLAEMAIFYAFNEI